MTILTEHHKIPGKFYPAFESIAEAKQISKTTTGIPSAEFNVWNLKNAPKMEYTEIGDVRLYASATRLKDGSIRHENWFTCKHDNHLVNYSTRCIMNEYKHTPEMIALAKKHNMFLVSSNKEVVSLINAKQLVVLNDGVGPIQHKWTYQTTSVYERELNPSSTNYGSSWVVIRNSPDVIAAFKLYFNEIDNVKSQLRYSFKALQAQEMGVDIAEVASAKRKINGMRRSIKRTNAIEKHYDTLRHTKEHLDEFITKFVSQDVEYEYEDIKKVIRQFELAKRALKAVGSAGKL